MAAALSAMRRAITDMASLANLALLGMGSGSIDHRYPGQLQRSPIINRRASSRIAPSECFYRHRDNLQTVSVKLSVSPKCAKSGHGDAAIGRNRCSAPGQSFRYLGDADLQRLGDLSEPISTVHPRQDPIAQVLRIASSAAIACRLWCLDR